MYNALIHIDIYLPMKFQVLVLCSWQNIRKFSKTTGPTENTFHHGIGGRLKPYSNYLGHLLLFIIVNPGSGGV